jgi:hypothetical protein
MGKGRCGNRTGPFELRELVGTALPRFGPDYGIQRAWRAGVKLFALTHLPR